MKKKTWIALGAGFVVVLCLTLYALYLYNKPTADIGKEKPAYTLEASDLIEAFITREAEATATYVDRVLEVTGALAGWTRDPEGNLTLFLEDELLGVSCLMERTSGDKAGARLGHDLVAGSRITLKGRCDGMLTDVKLSRGILVE